MMEKIKDKNIDGVLIYIHVLIQIILVTTTICLAQNIFIEKLNILLLIILYLENAMNYHLLLINKRKKFAEQGSFISIISSIYILTNMLALRYFNNWNIYIFYYVLLMVVEVYYIKLYSEGLIYVSKYYKLIAAYTLLMYASKLFSYNLFITIFQGGYFFIGIFPIYIIRKNKEKLNNFGYYSYKSLFLMALIFFTILIIQFFLPIINFSKTNIDIYIIIVSLETIKLCLEFMCLKAKDYLIMKKYGISYLIFWFVFFTVASFILSKDIFIALIFSMGTLLLAHMVNRLKFIEKNKDIIDPIDVSFKMNELINKQENLYIERTISFLHDEILQYIIVALRRLKEDNFLENREDIINLLQETINVTRGEINLYKPKFRQGENIYEAYVALIKDLQDRFNNYEILIDFNCEKTLELVEPYASVLYKCLHEIVINIFKHSKGYYSEICLYQRDNKIFLTTVNHGDYMHVESNNKVKNVGLKLLDFEVKKLGGKIDIKMDVNNLIESEESKVSINIEMPMKRKVIHENFISRRS